MSAFEINILSVYLYFYSCEVRAPFEKCSVYISVQYAGTARCIFENGWGGGGLRACYVTIPPLTLSLYLYSYSYEVRDPFAKCSVHIYTSTPQHAGTARCIFENGRGGKGGLPCLLHHHPPLTLSLYLYSSPMKCVISV
jgi:hypothetical protein